MAEITGLEALHLNFDEVNVDEWHKEILGHVFGEFDALKIDPYVAEERIPRSDRYTAEEIARKFKNRVTYVVGAKEWHIWNGKVHMVCEGDDIARHLVNIYSDELKKSLDVVKGLFMYKADLAKGMEDDKEKGEKKAAEQKKKYETMFRDHRGYRNNLDSTSGTKNVIEQMKTYLAVPSDYYDDDRDWFVMRNYVVDVKASRANRDIILVKHDPSRPVYRYMDVNYNPHATYPALQRFLDNSLADESQAKFFQKALGSVIIGAPVKTKTIIDAFGATDGGKSMINGVIEKLATDFYFEASEQAITKAGKDADMFRDAMRKARVVSFLEVKNKLDKAFILKYTGGDAIETTRKYRNSVVWRAQGIIMIMSNEGMNIGSQEEAVADRIERINFPHQFLPDHPDPRYRKDETLQSQIIAEDEGFLNWLLLGFKLHLTEDINMDGKIKPSESMALLKNEMQDSTNTASIFWDKYAVNRYEKNLNAPESKWVPLITVIADYRKWCKATEHPMMEESDVKAWMKREGLYKRASSQNRLIQMIEKPNASVSF